MKVRIYPQTETVKSILVERIGEAQKVIEYNNTELSKLTDNRIHNPYRESKERELKNSSVLYERDITSYRRQIALLDSHGKPECLVEIEL